MAGGIPGVAVGMATGGALLVYAGLRDVTPLAALREVAAGRVTGVSRTPSSTAVALASQAGGAGSTGPSSLTAGSGLVGAARKYVGGRYRFGGTDPATGLDCSALVQRSFSDIGVKGCPRTSGQQLLWGALTRVPSRAQVQPGDLVFWGVPVPTHVAIASSAGAATIVEARNHRTGIVEGKTWGTPNAYRRYAGAQSAAPGGGGGGSF